MEIDIIRPLFEKYRIQDTLPKIAEYVHILNIEPKNCYKNIDFYNIISNNRTFINLKICYFGSGFNKSEKRFIYLSLKEYLLNNTLFKNKILFNKKIDHWAYIDITKRIPNYDINHPYYDVNIYIYRNYCGYRTLYDNFRYFRKGCYRSRRGFGDNVYSIEYQQRKNHVYLDLTNIKTDLIY
jgi:hypothetical protein